MLDRLPVKIHPLRLVASQDTLRGELPLSAMTRLCELLLNSHGMVAMTLQFERDENNQPIARAHVRADLGMQCMRCGQPMTLHVDNHSVLGLVDAESEAKRLPDGYEALLIGEEPLTLSEIIEDELLLALPLVAMHDDNNCLDEWLPGKDDESSTDVAAKTDNPFAMLADLKSTLKE